MASAPRSRSPETTAIGVPAGIFARGPASAVENGHGGRRTLAPSPDTDTTQATAASAAVAAARIFSRTPSIKLAAATPAMAARKGNAT